jgi:hypothetical protein
MLVRDDVAYGFLTTFSILTLMRLCPHLKTRDPSEELL